MVKDFNSKKDIDSKWMISGHLGDQNVADIIQFLEIAGHTGWLFIESGELAGRVAVREGRIVSATFGNLSGEAAFYALVAVSNGEFRFQSTTDIPEERTVHTNNYALILNALKKLDEEGREAVLSEVQWEGEEKDVSKNTPEGHADNNGLKKGDDWLGSIERWLEEHQE